MHKWLLHTTVHNVFINEVSLRAFAYGSNDNFNADITRSRILSLVNLSAGPPVRMSTCLPIHQSSACLPVHPLTRPPVSLSARAPVRPSVISIIHKMNGL